MSAPPRRPSATDGRPSAGRADRAEAALVGHYARWVRLAYLVLPADLGKHRRVLVAHGLVQRALPRVRTPKSAASAARVPAQRGTAAADADGTGAEKTGGAETDVLRARVVRAVLDHQRPRRLPERLLSTRTYRPVLPLVWGLRLFPRPGGAQEAALDRALARVPAPARAAFVLRRLEGLDDREALGVLATAEVDDPAAALSAARGLDGAVPLGEEDEGAVPPWHSDAFDAAALRARPTDLRQRRRRLRLGLAVAAGATAGAVVLGVTLPGDSGAPPPRHTAVAGPADLARTPRDAWADTARVDFTAWPARGARTDDRALLDRALSAWEDPPREVRVTDAEGAGTDPARSGVRLLFAGDVDGRTVVLLHAPERLVRYTEPSGSGGTRTLDFTRADDADVTTAAAVALTRGSGRVRYLTAPWIAESQTRDLLRPDVPGRPLARTRDGVTAPVPVPRAAAGGPGRARRGACEAWPALQLRSSTRIVEKHAFLVTDLGGVSPAHLTYTPLPGRGAPPRQPREATGPDALRAWARTVCGLPGLHARDVRAVNVWDFAEQRLPAGGGRAVWACTRATTWRGPGEIQIRLRAPARSAREDGQPVAQARNTAACGRFGQHLVAGTVWKGEDGHRWALAAGSREVARTALRGGGVATGGGRTLRARLRDGEARPRLALTAKLREAGARPEVCASWSSPECR